MGAESVVSSHRFGIRKKLISIFVVIKILPLVVMAWYSWDSILHLVTVVQQHFQEEAEASREVTKMVGKLSTENSIVALDKKATEAIERLTTDTARQVAKFLYDRDSDIELATLITPSEKHYADFLKTKYRGVTVHPQYIYDEKKGSWFPRELGDDLSDIVVAKNKDNRKDFHSRTKELSAGTVNRPLYLEMTYVDRTGQELIKVTSRKEKTVLFDISKKENTYCKAETYFSELQQLAPGDVYVSEVIGAYVRTDMIGTYNKDNATKKGIAFNPEQSAYAGKENPVGKKFEGIIRWAAPVARDGEIQGYVTLALDHTHVMEFTDHIIPTEERYALISNAGSGNYAFMWDYKDRNISHPRDYFIVGYEPDTGELVVPWLEEDTYNRWQDHGGPISRFLAGEPEFHEQSLKVSPSKELMKQGTVALDCRYLNFAPQCDGWNNLTQHGGSGSFLMFWSGLWKLSTGAAIPYFTGRYGETERGFGFITIGANVNEFHKAAIETADEITFIEELYLENLANKNTSNQQFLVATLRETTMDLALYTAFMAVLVIMIAVWMASSLTGRITYITEGMRRFQKGDMSFRFKSKSNDEMDDLASTFNQMAETLKDSLISMEKSKNLSDEANTQLLAEIRERQKAEQALAEHRDKLEMLVAQRTSELSDEIEERKQVEESKSDLEARLFQAEKMEAIGTLAGGVAHDLNNILSGIVTYPDLLLLEMSPANPQYRTLHTIKQSGERAAAIVQDLLTLARRGVMDFKSVKINDIITRYTQSPDYLQYGFEYPDIQVVFNLKQDVLPVFGSDSHLSLVVMNLIVNGVESISGAGNVTVTTETCYLETSLRLYEEVQPGEYVTLTISDSGMGIDQKDIDRIFEPFYTTEKMGGRSGTGLGMAVVWGVIHDHKGYIDCSSDLGRGTTFTIYFPVFRGQEIVPEES